MAKYNEIKHFMEDCIPLNRYSGLIFQQELGLIWHPLEYDNFKNEYGISIYYEPHSYPSTKDKTLLALRKKVENKEGYLFSITIYKKQYIGFRKKAWENNSDIIMDLMDYFGKSEEE